MLDLFGKAVTAERCGETRVWVVSSGISIRVSERPLEETRIDRPDNHCRSSDDVVKNEIEKNKRRGTA